MNDESGFISLTRQQFRQYFQPSRIVLAVIPAPNASGVNIITLCFTMHCSYKPPMVAMAIQNINASFGLIQNASEYVLAVPGQSMIDETMFCGLKSMVEIPDKAKTLSLDLLPSEKIAVPGLAKAIANVEMVKELAVETGDHLLVVGRARNFRVNKARQERALLSIGPDVSGYTLLAQKGIHRIGVAGAEKVN